MKENQHIRIMIWCRFRGYPTSGNSGRWGSLDMFTYFFHMFTCVYIYRYTYIYIYLHIYTYIYIYLHTFIYIHTFFGKIDFQISGASISKLTYIVYDVRFRRWVSFLLVARCLNAVTICWTIWQHFDNIAIIILIGDHGEWSMQIRRDCTTHRDY